MSMKRFHQMLKESRCHGIQEAVFGPARPMPTRVSLVVGKIHRPERPGKGNARTTTLAERAEKLKREIAGLQAKIVAHEEMERLNREKLAIEADRQLIKFG